MNGTLRALALLALLGLNIAWVASATLLNRGALLHIVQSQCLPRWRTQPAATPCLQVSLPASGGERDGSVVLADRKGGAHFLLIPTRPISGIESPVLLDADTPNYFAAAWEARTFMEQFLHRPLPRDAVGLAINARRSRGQDQLHIHIECLGAQLQGELKALSWVADDQWHSIRLGRFRYQALRANGERLGALDPFKRVARDLPQAASDMGAYTVLVAGWTFADAPGFIVVASPAAPGSETLLDSTCAVAP